MMTGHIRHATGLRIGVNCVGRAPTRHLNPVPYFFEYFGHKIHLDREACALWRHRGNKQVVFGGIISRFLPSIT